MNCKEVFNIIIHVQVKFDTEIIDLQCVNYIVHTIGYRNNIGNSMSPLINATKQKKYYEVKICQKHILMEFGGGIVI